MSEIEHDENRWGVAYTAEATPRELVRLADLVKREMASDRTKSLGDAVILVINALCGGPKIEFFLLQKARKARALRENDWWVTPLRSRSEWIVKGGAMDFCSSWALVPDTAADLAEYPLDERKQGLAGMFFCLRECWYMTAKTPADLNEDLAARVAILKCAAQDLFNAPTTPADAAPAKKLKNPGDVWNKEHRAGLLAQCESLTAGFNAVKVASADEQVGNIWGISASSVKQQRLLAIKERKQASSSDGDMRLAA